MQGTQTVIEAAPPPVKFIGDKLTFPDAVGVYVAEQRYQPFGIAEILAFEKVPLVAPVVPVPVGGTLNVAVPDCVKSRNMNDCAVPASTYST
jgi:hypothetical protein